MIAFLAAKAFFGSRFVFLAGNLLHRYNNAVRKAREAQPRCAH